MPRTLDASELFRYLTDLSVARILSGGGDQSLTASAAAQTSLVTIGATTSFSAGDPVIITGSGGTDLNQIATLGASIQTLLYKTPFAQSIGARMVETSLVKLGHLEEGGPVFSGSQQLTPIFSSITRGAIQYIYGPGEMELQLGLLGFNGLNLQTIFGMTENEFGAGTSADPSTVGLQGAQFGTQTLQCFRATGVRFDAKNILFDFNDAKAVANGAVNMNGKAPAVLPMSLKFTSAVLRIYT